MDFAFAVIGSVAGDGLALGVGSGDELALSVGSGVPPSGPREQPASTSDSTPTTMYLRVLITLNP